VPKLDPLVAKIAQWRDDPESFVREALGATYVAPWQIEALQALATGDRVAIRSGHGVGKSVLLSWLILWWLLTRDNAKIPCVAPTQHQLDDVLWTECRIWHKRLPEAFQKQIEFSADRIYLTHKPKESYAAARTARKENPEALQGFHSGNMLFLFDEASGVDDLIFEVGRGALSTPGSKVVMCGNPTRIEGYFFDAFHRNRSRWHCMKVSVADLGDAPYIDLKFAEEIEEEFSKDSNVYRVRVLGEFPTEGENTVIPLHLIEEAVERKVKPTGSVVWGLDVARFGEDRTALCKRRGNRLVEKIKWWRNKDTSQIRGLIVREWEDTPDEDKPDWVVVDSIGYGAGVVDQLRDAGLPARGCNVAESATASDKYMRLRDELWFKARDWFQERDGSIVRDDMLIGELSTVLYEITSTGKFKVESKDERKARLAGRVTTARSPDLADAFIMTFAASSRSRFRRKKRKYPWESLKMRQFV
jgi:hypothetical protein